MRTIRREQRQQGRPFLLQGAYRHGQGVATYLARYARGGSIKDYRLAEVAAARVAFCYRAHHDGREHILKLDTESFIARVLWHVPPKGQHTVRYYGLYVPNARAKRNRARDALGYLPEAPVPNDKRERTCPRCGHRLWLLARRYGEISSQRERVVQQYVEAAATNLESFREALLKRPPPSFFDRRAAA